MRKETREAGRIKEEKETSHRNRGLFAVELLAASTRRVDNNSELSAHRSFYVGELTPRFVTNGNQKHPLNVTPPDTRIYERLG